MEHGVAESLDDFRYRSVDTFATYPFTGCLLPGAARLRLFTEKGWDEIWRTPAFLRRTECFRRPDPKYDSPSDAL